MFQTTNQLLIGRSFEKPQFHGATLKESSLTNTPYQPVHPHYDIPDMLSNPMVNPKIVSVKSPFFVRYSRW